MDSSVCSSVCLMAAIDSGVQALVLLLSLEQLIKRSFTLDSENFAQEFRNRDVRGLLRASLIKPVFQGRVVVQDFRGIEPEPDLSLCIFHGVRPVADVAPHLTQEGNRVRLGKGVGVLVFGRALPCIMRDNQHMPGFSPTRHGGRPSLIRGAKNSTADFLLVQVSNAHSIGLTGRNERVEHRPRVRPRHKIPQVLPKGR